MLRRPKVPKIPRQSANAREQSAHTSTIKTSSSAQKIPRKIGEPTPGIPKKQVVKKQVSAAQKHPGMKNGLALWAGKLRLPGKKTRVKPRETTAESASAKPEVNSFESRPTFTLRIPRGITRMAAAALLTCIVPWFIFLGVSAAVYFSTSANPWMVDTLWTDSLAVGSSIWALGFAVPLRVVLGRAASLSVFPLGLWILYVLLGGRLARAFVLDSRAVLWVYPFVQAIVATLVGLVVRGAYNLGELFLWSLLHGFAAIIYAFYLFDRDQRPAAVKLSLLHPKARLSADFGRFKQWSQAFIIRLRKPDHAYSQDLENRRLGIDRDERSWDGANSTWTVPGWVISGLRAGWQMFMVFGVATLILVCVQVFSQFAAVNKIYELYGVSLGAGILIWVAQLLYLPTVQAWALAWILGPGFQQGTGTIRSLTQVKTGPIPAVPALGALPSQTPGYWVLALIAGLSLVIGYLLYTSMARVDFFSHVASFLVGSLSFTLLTTWFCFLSSGSIGAGRMAVWGPEPLTVAAMGFILVWLPILLVVTVAHPRSRAYLADNFFRAKRASARVTRQSLAVAKEKAKDYRSWNPLSAANAAKNEEVAEGEQTATEKEENATEEGAAVEPAEPSLSAEGVETAEIAKTCELPATDSQDLLNDEASDNRQEAGKTFEDIPEETENALETSEKSQNDQEVRNVPSPQTPQETFARSRGALPVDTEEIKDLATDWAERKTDEVIAKERQELEKIKSSAQRLSTAELKRPAIKRSIFKRGRLQVGKPHRDADDTSTQAIELPDQD